jgi:histidinol phosphatase-like enzyme
MSITGMLAVGTGEKCPFCELIITEDTDTIKHMMESHRGDLSKELKIDAIIVDVDGTLALMEGKRTPFEWDKVSLDAPNLPIIDLVHILQDTGLKVIITTGRDGVALNDTKAWLTSHGVVYDAIFSRPAGNNDPDTEIKKDIYYNHIKDKYNIKYVVDDRICVVKMWRELGLTVLQVAEGDF